MLGQPVARRGLALREREPNDAVDAHDLAGRAHLGTEDRVDLGEAVERQHRFLHRDVTALRPAGAAALPSRSSASVAPTMTRAATFASGTPVALLTNGTVRLARGFASMHEHLAVLHRVLHVEQPDDVERVGQRVRCAPRSSRATSAESVGGGIAHAESPECTPASSMCSMTPPMTHVAGRVAQRVDVDLDRVLEEAVDRARAARPRARLRARAIRCARARPSRGAASVVVVHDLHRAAAEHVRRADEHRIADAVAATATASSTVVAIPPVGLRDAEAFAQRVELLAVLGRGRSTSGLVPEHRDARRLERVRAASAGSGRRGSTITPASSPPALAAAARRRSARPRSVSGSKNSRSLVS